MVVVPMLVLAFMHLLILAYDSMDNSGSIGEAILVVSVLQFGSPLISFALVRKLANVTLNDSGDQKLEVRRQSRLWGLGALLFGVLILVVAMKLELLIINISII